MFIFALMLLFAGMYDTNIWHDSRKWRLSGSADRHAPRGVHFRIVINIIWFFFSSHHPLSLLEFFQSNHICQKKERPSLRNYNAPIVCPIRDKDGDLGCIGKPLKCHIWARGCKYLEYIARTQMGLLVQRPYPESCTIYITPR